MRDPGRADPPDRAANGPDRPAIADVPAARDRLGRASAQLLAAVLVAVSGLAALVLWHLARRGRLIRDGLGPPRRIRWPEDPDGRPDRTEEP
ncbi:hypothetical protein [Tautonia plasticadhaerens]|uniref:Uncharacterized protein n=1 Tax=Tautonia plasticadhaerens TaxID=2527974 RepID=A0A518H6W4_9BACT|nr:hypothetical protein [Tautonia plasticadhaerens]QDV36578.1 hypothetical protein ElP_45060 [Tautonia plasticadhaerens]